MTDRFGIIDPDRSTCLCDVGQPDYAAVTVIDPDGADRLVLAECATINDPTVSYRSDPPPHEHLGPLPPRWGARVALAPFYCGRPTRAGRPCRIPVAAPGQRCSWHPTERKQ
ncbi:hypothetical protein [Mycobacterium sp.]|uniref:hypothetical protein n=1 Tax=Mycobacterium sp. TaxID=1785 RepID=UPI003F98954C